MNLAATPPILPGQRTVEGLALAGGAQGLGETVLPQLSGLCIPGVSCYWVKRVKIQEDVQEEDTLSYLNSKRCSGTSNEDNPTGQVNS